METRKVITVISTFHYAESNYLQHMEMQKVINLLLPLKKCGFFTWIQIHIENQSLQGNYRYYFPRLEM